MQRQLVGDPHRGTIMIRGVPMTGIIKPTIFFTNSVFGIYPVQTILGVTYTEHGGKKESEHTLHAVARAFHGKPMTVLGPRWVGFVTALLEKNHIVDDDLAREAWFAANREPTALMIGNVERGCAVMKTRLGEALVERIRDITPDITA